jgi:hypothetical protein
MKRFLVFAGDDYYPSGGWKDFHSDHDTLKEAADVVNARHVEDWCKDELKLGGLLQWVHIVDTLTTEPIIIWRREGGKEPP